MLYSLDGWGKDGVIGKTGTTATAAMMFMSNWFNSYGRLGRIPDLSHFYTRRAGQHEGGRPGHGGTPPRQCRRSAVLLPMWRTMFC